MDCFLDIKAALVLPALEALIVMVIEARPSLSQQGLLRVAQAVPATKEQADMESISEILASYGKLPSDQASESMFWEQDSAHIERTKPDQKTCYPWQRQGSKESRPFTWIITCAIRD